MRYEKDYSCSLCGFTNQTVGPVHDHIEENHGTREIIDAIAEKEDLDGSRVEKLRMIGRDMSASERRIALIERVSSSSEVTGEAEKASEAFHPSVSKGY